MSRRFMSPEVARDVGCADLARQVVAHALGLSAEEIESRHSRRAAEARQLAMYVSHVTFGMSYARIALAFGRDPSTVSHGCLMVEEMRESEPFNACLEAVERCLRASPVWAGYRPWGDA